VSEANKERIIKCVLGDISEPSKVLVGVVIFMVANLILKFRRYIYHEANIFRIFVFTSCSILANSIPTLMALLNEAFAILCV